uniref:Uncharacterized protein n=1 Tax=Arundo donax TaxID=35708 RepID=A0A0A8Y1D5_ARUDO
MFLNYFLFSFFQYSLLFLSSLPNKKIRTPASHVLIHLQNKKP